MSIGGGLHLVEEVTASLAGYVRFTRSEEAGTPRSAARRVDHDPDLLDLGRSTEAP